MYHCQSVKCLKNRHKRVKWKDHMKLKTHAHDNKNKLAQLLKPCKSPCEFCEQIDESLQVRRGLDYCKKQPVEKKNNKTTESEEDD